MDHIAPAWTEVARLQASTRPLSARAAVGAEAAIDAVLTAIATSLPHSPQDARRAAATAERRERHRLRSLRMNVHEAGLEELRLSARGDPEAGLVARDGLRRALSLVTAVDAIILVHVADGEGASEVGRSTGLAAATVRQRVSRTRARVRALLAA